MDSSHSGNVSLCMSAAEDHHETLTSTVSQMGLSDGELTAITTLEKEVCFYSYTANAVYAQQSVAKV